MSEENKAREDEILDKNIEEAIGAILLNSNLTEESKSAIFRKALEILNK